MLPLQDLISRLEQENPNKIIKLGFHNPHSYRGYYEQLAFEPKPNAVIGEMLACAKEALGKTFEGYKGGEYTMTQYTECWISEYGTSSCDPLGVLFLELLLKDEVVNP